MKDIHNKYALCGLFAIDDSTDDPDAQEQKPKAAAPAPKAQPKRIAPKLADADDDYEPTGVVAIQSTIKAIAAAGNMDELKQIWHDCGQLQSNPQIKEAATNRKNQLIAL